MGRPLNKKYFGNRNIGTGGYQVTGNLSNSQNYADDRIGGEGIASITADPLGLGSILINDDNAEPTLTRVPGIPGGVTASITVTWEVESVTVTNGLAGNGYTTTTGGATTLTGLGGGATFNITAVGSGQGEVQTIVPVNRGNFTSSTFNFGAVTFQINGGDGNQQANVYFRVKTIAVTEKGSGYTSGQTFTWNDGGGHDGTMPNSPSYTLTTDTGFVGSSTNQENAIIINANTGNGAGVGDIIKQSNARSYKVRVGGNVAVCKLVANDSLATRQAFIKATDSNGNTYFVTKLTAHKALLTQWNNNESEWIYQDGQTAPWTFDSTANGRVIIENA